MKQLIGVVERPHDNEEKLATNGLLHDGRTRNAVDKQKTNASHSNQKRRTDRRKSCGIDTRRGSSKNI